MPPGIVPPGHDRAGHRHHQGRPHPGHPRAVRPALPEAGPDAGRAALRPRPARDARRPLGRQGGRQQGPGARACGASAGATSRSCACRPGSRRSASTAGRPRGPSSWAWGASPCRSATSRSTRWPSPSASAPRAAASSSRSTSRTRLDDRERRILARMERLRVLAEAGGAAGAARPMPPRGRPMPERAAGRLRAARRPIGTGRRCRTARRAALAGGRRRGSTTPHRAALLPERRRARPQGHVRQAARASPARSTTPARRCSSAARPAAPGAGLVTLAVPESLQPLFAAKVVEATTMALPEDDVEEVDPEPALARILDHEHDAIVVGPGLRPGWRRPSWSATLLAGARASRRRRRSSSTPRRSARSPRWTRGGTAIAAPAVLTPHAGEFARLRAGQRRRPGRRRRPGARRRRPGRGRPRCRARPGGQVVVLKGARTVIAAPDGAVAVAPFENPALATGGTGDVLAGAIGSLLAQGLAPFDAARLGVYLHGLAGDGGPRADRRRRACWPRTCPTAWPSPASGWRRWPTVAGRQSARIRGAMDLAGERGRRVADAVGGHSPGRVRPWRHGAAAHHEARLVSWPRAPGGGLGCTMPRPAPVGCAGHGARERFVGPDRTLERRYLRPRGRCHRQSREPVAVDVDGGRRRHQARRR